MTDLHIKEFTEIEVSSDGMSLIAQCVLTDGATHVFHIPYATADVLAQGILRVADVAVKRQMASGQAMNVAAVDEVLMTEGVRVAVNAREGVALLQAVGRWKNTGAPGMTSLIIDGRQANKVAKELLQAARVMPQMARPS